MAALAWYGPCSLSAVSPSGEQTNHSVVPFSNESLIWWTKKKSHHLWQVLILHSFFLYIEMNGLSFSDQLNKSVGTGWVKLVFRSTLVDRPWHSKDWKILFVSDSHAEVSKKNECFPSLLCKNRLWWLVTQRGFLLMSRRSTFIEVWFHLVLPVDKPKTVLSFFFSLCTFQAHCSTQQRFFYVLSSGVGIGKYAVNSVGWSQVLTGIKPVGVFFPPSQVELYLLPRANVHQTPAALTS